MIKRFLYILITGLFIDRIVYLLTKNKVTIISYHNPSREVISSHLNYLSKLYQFISLDQYVESLYDKDKTLPKHAMVITFDDGHLDNRELFDLFKKYNVKPTIYCCSNVVGTYHSFWWKQLQANKVVEYKKMTNKRRLQKIGKEKGYFPDLKTNRLEALTLEDLERFKTIGIIGAHTRNHPVLTKCTDQELNDEIVNCKSELEKKINKQVRHFAYPNGNYNQKCIELLKHSGYSSARTTDVGWNDSSSNPFKLKVIGINDDSSVLELRAFISAIPGWLILLIQGNGIFGKKIRE